MAKRTGGKYVAGRGTGPAVAAAITDAQARGKNPSDSDFGSELVKRRHEDWRENQINWRQLMDSLEGGDRYRNATYGPNRKGMPCRNLFRHRREYPNPQEFPNNLWTGMGGYAGANGGVAGSAAGYGPFAGDLGADPGATDQDDDYEMRRSRTPIPVFVKQAIDIHLGKVYDQEVSRVGPPVIEDWWKDVDGCGTPIDDYMRETIAPMLMVLGQLDVCLDHPRLPEGERLATQADVLRLELNKCVASYILPENMVWYRLNAAGRYSECLVREYVDAAERTQYKGKDDPIDAEENDDDKIAAEWRMANVRWRHWNAVESTLYSCDGEEVLERIPHKFGRVPIVRLFDTKKPRSRNVGMSRYQATADHQRAYYNRDSELTMSDILQAHPSLSGSKNFCKGDQTVSVGPGGVLPIDVTPDGTVIPWGYVSPPKDPADSLRANLQAIEDRIDRFNGLTKPAGVKGTTGGTVGQSGISKQLDAVEGDKILTSIAKSLAKSERDLAEYAYLVLTGAPPTPEVLDQIVIGYSTRFELHSADELASGAIQLQKMMAQAGSAPNLERELVQATYRQLLPGLSDEDYRDLDAEIEALMETKAIIKAKMHEMPSNAIDQSNAMATSGSTEQAGGIDPSGQSNATAVTNFAPTIA